MANKELIFYGIPVSSIDVPGDGSCLVHCFCAAVDSKYYRLGGDIAAKTKYVRQLRLQIAEHILKENGVLQQFIKKELPGLMHNANFKSLAMEMASQRSLPYYFAPIISYYVSDKEQKIDSILIQEDVLFGKRKAITPIYGKVTHSFIKGDAKYYILIVCSGNHYYLLRNHYYKRGNLNHELVKNYFYPENLIIKKLLQDLK